MKNPSSLNNRLNPSILIKNVETNENVLVDMGKTFREASLKHFQNNQISHIDKGFFFISKKKRLIKLS